MTLYRKCIETGFQAVTHGRVTNLGLFKATPRDFEMIIEKVKEQYAKTNPGSAPESYLGKPITIKVFNKEETFSINGS
jgi:hypothetical protein